MTFSDWPWRHWRRLREEAQALRLNERRLSWRELCAQIDALAVGFHAQGVRDGDGVLLRAYNQPDALLAWLALLQCGARVLPLNPQLPAPLLAELHPLSYQEPLIAALPASWPEAARAELTLSALNHRPLFWFKRERNPDFFDYTRRIFDRAGYVPTYVEEPAEHDVLLARIARGEGLILLPASFSAIQRQGVVFCPLQDASQQLPLRLGMVTLPANERVRERVTAVVEKSLL